MIAAAEKTGKLYLIDAHAYLHRAYHALPPLKNSKGEPVGALYGFARMLLSLLKREKPEFLAVCLDMPGKTFRHEKSAAYKATRKPTDQDLRSQLAQARGLAEAMGLRCFGVAGYEADDVMATLAKSGAEKGFDVVLVTGDKDALQLVGGKVRVWNESKGEMMDAQKIIEKYKVAPSQIVDYLALIGDVSDNVKGVAGIGPVGAVKLLAQFGSLDRVLEAARAGDPSIPERAAESLRQSVESVRLGRELLALDAKTPLDGGPGDCRISRPEPARVQETFARFEFVSLLKELLPGSSAEGPAPQAAEGTTVSIALPQVPAVIEPVAVGVWLEAAAKAGDFSIAFCPTAEEPSDAEPGLPLTGCWAFALSLPDGTSCRIGPDEASAHRAALGKLFADATRRKVAHDWKALLAPLKEADLEAFGPRFDTMLAAWCVDPGRGKYDFASVWKSFGGGALAEESPGRAALRQAQLVWTLEKGLKAALSDARLMKLYEDLELPLVDLLWEMEEAGIAVDAAYLRGLKVDFAAALVKLKGELDRLAGAEFNPNSPKQLGKLLFEDLGLAPLRKTPGGAPSTDEDTLQALAKQHPIPAKVLEYREISKLQGTYVDALLARLDNHGRVHTRFNQAGTATGRLSSLEPNLQNIPVRSALGQKIRRAFVAPAGKVLLSADYSQIDLRVLAHLCEDPVLTDSFRTGADIHRRTASEVFGVEPSKVDAEMRRRAKAVNFGIVYGQTAFGLSQELGITPGAAREYIDAYKARYSGVAAWGQKNLEEARASGCVKTILGRVRRLPDVNAKNTAVRQFNERAAGNAPIQGSSADIIKVAMLHIRAAQRDPRSKLPAEFRDVRMLLQVHDELLFEVSSAAAGEFGVWVKRVMEEAVTLKVPVVVDVKAGPNWQEMKRA